MSFPSDSPTGRGGVSPAPVMATSSSSPSSASSSSSDSSSSSSPSSSSSRAEMDDATYKFLCEEKSLTSCVQAVTQLVNGGMSRNDAWMLAGEIYGYTGNVKPPDLIFKMTGTNKDMYPRNPGGINDYLRDKAPGSDLQMENLLGLFRDISLLPDWTPSVANKPTRMMDAYPLIDQDYREGNVLLMADVGSVARDAPDSKSEYYKRQYRLHVTGGLKDVTAMNKAQQEVIYAPGSAYLVVNREAGKVKAKKGNQAHEHIYLQYVLPDSNEYKTAAAKGRVFDLRDPKRHSPAI